MYIHSLSSDMRGVWHERCLIREVSDMRGVWHERCLTWEVSDMRGEWQCIRIHNSTLHCISTMEIEKYNYLIWVACYSSSGDKHWIWLFWFADIIRVSCANRTPHDSPLGVVYLPHRSHQVVQSVHLTTPPPRPHPPTFFGGSTGRASPTACTEMLVLCTMHFTLYSSHDMLNIGIMQYYVINQLTNFYKSWFHRS